MVKVSNIETFSHTGASALESPTTSTIGIASKLLLGLDWVLLVVPWLKDGDISSLVSMLVTINVTFFLSICIEIQKMTKISQVISRTVVPNTSVRD